MPDSENQFKRVTDFTEAGKEPNIQDAWHLASLAHSRINELKIEQDLLKRAFLKDDLGTPDYEGHRKSHGVIATSEKVVQEYKVGMTKDFIKIFVGAVCGMILLGLVTYLRG